MIFINNETFKKIIIIFWFLWWLIALWTDVVGGIAHLGWINATWAPDTNFPALIDALNMYHAPLWLSSLFFIGILLWSLISTIVFFWASIAVNKRKDIWLKRVNIAFIISISYWLAFFLADQAVMNFSLEENHMVQGGFELLSYFAFYILP